MSQNYEFRVERALAEHLTRYVSCDNLLSSLLESRSSLDGNTVSIRLNVDEAERIRECLTTQLAEIGFDENYLPNRHGKNIENLLDILYLK